MQKSIKLQDYQTQGDTFEVLLKDMETFKPDMIMMSITNTTIFDDIKVVNELSERYHPPSALWCPGGYTAHCASARALETAVHQARHPIHGNAWAFLRRTRSRSIRRG